MTPCSDADNAEDVRDIQVRSPIVALTGIDKRFGAVRAVNGVSFAIRAGEIVGLIGANGAGKSTAMRILAGEVQHDAGEIRVDGVAVSFKRPRDASRLGIAKVAQELELVQDQSVADNMFLGRLPSRRGVVRDRQLTADASAMLESLGVRDIIDPGQPMSALSPVEQRLITIAAALAQRPRVLILDEPTAALAPDIARRLFPIFNTLAAGGTAIVYISHRLLEIKELSERVLVMRDGELVAERRTQESAVSEMVKLVGGKDLETPPITTRRPQRENGLMRLRGVSGHRLSSVDVTLYEGELVGIGGLQGSGRSELMRILGGAQKPRSGTVEFRGSPLRSSRDAVKKGVGLLPEGRPNMVLRDFDVASNATIASLSAHKRGRVLLRRSDERRAFASVADRIMFVGNPDAPIGTLSGGNQQKVLIARWLLRNVKLLLLDEPTAGIDVHARAEIHELLRALVREGTTVVVACSEPEELVLLCDRVIVLTEGAVAGPDLFAPFGVDEIVAASFRHTRSVQPGAAPPATEVRQR